MQRQRDGLVPIAEAFSDLSGPVAALRDASPQALHHFTRFDQVNQLVSASEADPDRGFMARMMALCSLPRTNPGDRKEYKRVNGPFTLYMIAGGDNKLPFGNFPRLIGPEPEFASWAAICDGMKWPPAGSSLLTSRFGASSRHFSLLQKRILSMKRHRDEHDLGERWSWTHDEFDLLRNRTDSGPITT